MLGNKRSLPPRAAPLLDLAQCSEGKQVELVSISRKFTN